MKSEKYSGLVSLRKQCSKCIGLRNPAEPGLSQFDSEEIGPWSRLHGDQNARVMVVGQDWGDVRYFQANKGLDNLRNPTMLTLEKLLQVAGQNVSLQKYTAGNHGLFLTNAILCLKSGGLQAQVDRSWFGNCGTMFLRPQIEIVAPQVVVTLGQQAYEATTKAFGLHPGPFRQAVESEKGVSLDCGSQLFAVYHCGNRILNTHRKYEEQVRDWQRIGAYLAK